MAFFKYLILGGGNKTQSLMIADSEDVKAVHIPEGRPSMDTASIIGLIIWFACVLYSSIRSSSNAQAARYRIYFLSEQFQCTKIRIFEILKFQLS